MYLLGSIGYLLLFISVLIDRKWFTNFGYFDNSQKGICVLSKFKCSFGIEYIEETRRRGFRWRRIRIRPGRRVRRWIRFWAWSWWRWWHRGGRRIRTKRILMTANNFFWENNLSCLHPHICWGPMPALTAKHRILEISLKFSV